MVLRPQSLALGCLAPLALLCAAVAAANAPRTSTHREPPQAGSTQRAHAPDSDADEQGDGSDEDAPDDYARAIEQIQSKPYVVDTIEAEALQLQPPQLPDLSPYTSAALNDRIVPRPAGRASVARMLQDNAFKAFMGGDERLREWALRQFSLPKAIYIEGGYVTPHELARMLPKSQFEETAKGVFIARLPIDIRPNATLHIDASVKELRLSLDRGAFLVNEGKLFITGSRLLAWDERAHAPAWFKDEHDFRPFITSWGGSETYIADSSLSHLGYAASKSYGVSISQFSPGLAPAMNRPGPRGWILNSDFSDLWYGFYCYEAEDFVVRGNVYHDNIKYGIDPHDRSLRLIIAENAAYGTKIKHGIIVSREVNDSWIFDNKSYDNHLSGIVVDRNSVNNIVAHNQVYRNASDGITIYESPRTLIWQNLATGNGRHGIRVRNSTEVRLYDNAAIGNNLTGIYGHIKDLADSGRNLRLDPFNLKVSMQVVGGQLVSNGSAPITIDQPLSLELYNIDLRAPRREMGIKFSGILGANQEKVLDILLRQKQAVMVKPAAATLTGSR